MGWLLAPFRALAALIATAWAFVHWKPDPAVQAVRWFYCRQQAHGKPCCGAQCQLCAEDQGRFRTRGEGSVPNTKGVSR